MVRPKVSVAIPVYNTELYLHKCLDSIINQTLKEIEIILVDDGSTDCSGAICDEYAAKDRRIKVIHKKNGGLASARQVGLERMTGEYYTVCDSDDWIELNMCEALYNRACTTDADVVLSGYYANYPDGREIRLGGYIYETQEQYISDVISRRVEPMTCSKLIKTDTLRRYNIIYDAGINLGEDALFLSKLLMYPLNIVSEDRAYYHYRRDMSGNSYTNHITVRSILELKYVKDWQEQHYVDAKYAKAHILANINLCFAAVRAVDITKREYKEIVGSLSVRDILSHRIISLKSIFCIFTKIFGFAISKRVFNLIYPLFYK